MPISSGTRLGRYEIRSRLGAGGMGEVYLAQDTKLDRKVALKILPGELASHRDRMERFIREAKAAATLNHPNIAHIYEIGEADGANFIAMEYVDGATLSEKISRDGAQWAKLLHYLQQVAEGLAKAHAAGVVHRDIKPDNIMITRDGHAKILDFGLAKLIEGRGDGETRGRGDESNTLIAASPRHSVSAPGTSPGLILGTVGYMSPEQAQAKPVDQRSDIFSFGCVLYEAATGRKPFDGSSVVDTLHKIIFDPAPAITDFNPSASPELQRVIRKCLAKEPEKRYQTIRDTANDLEELIEEMRGLSETERSVAASSSATTSTAPGVTDEAVRAESTGPVSRPPASSAEYVVAGIKQHKLVTVIALVVLVVAVVGLGLFLHARNTEVAIESIAVLPFENQNRDPNQDYLSDGVTESIINSLTQLPNLRVIARSSVFRYKGKETDPLALGKELGVRAVLVGRMMQRGDNLTISTELVDVRDNKQLWGEQYERKASDLMSMQRDIAGQIVNNLRLKISGEEHNRMMKHYTENPEAYQLYLKGRFYWNKRTAESLKKGIEYFQQAIDKDPNYALAYTGLADGYSSLGLTLDAGSLSPSEAIPKASAAAVRALQMDDTLAEAHTSLAFIRLHYDWDWSDAEREFKRAIELNPNYDNAHHWYSHYLMALGRTEESLSESKRFLELDQIGLITNAHLGWHYLYAHKYDLAIEQLQKALEMDPNYGLTHWYLGEAYEQKAMYPEATAELRKAQGLLKENVAVEAEMGLVYALSGKRDEAQKVIDELKQISKGRYVSSYHLALIYIGLGEKDRAFESLENAYRERSDSLVYLKVDPRLDTLHSDPRFADLIRRVGLPQ
jgi:eukaryotic-like serine/threonine-protein kinase